MGRTFDLITGAGVRYDALSLRCIRYAQCYARAVKASKKNLAVALNWKCTKF